MNQTTAEVAPEIALLRQTARNVRNFVLANVDGLSHEESVKSPQPAGSSVNWVLGHLIQSYEETLPYLGQKRVLAEGALDRYRRGSPPLTDEAEAFEFGELLRLWDEATARIAAGIDSLTSDALAETRNYLGGKSETTLAKFLNFILLHQGYHAGQLGLLRRLAGKEGAIP